MNLVVSDDLEIFIVQWLNFSPELKCDLTNYRGFSLELDLL